jgi:hypothetical protein
MPAFARLVQDLDPGGKFRNEFLDRYLPVAVPETP